MRSGRIRLVETAAQDALGSPQFFAKAVSIAEAGGAKAFTKLFGVVSGTKLLFDGGAYGVAYAKCAGWIQP
jgi:hypothetical protein